MTLETEGRLKAVLIDGQCTSGRGNDNPMVTADADAPALTLTANGRQRLRTLLIGDQHSQEAPPESPSFCVRTRAFPRALLGARVVRLTPRCLARFQSMPDSYILPERTALAAKIIGNGVPCLLAQRVMESLA